jgi:hypothetical protein
MPPVPSPPPPPPPPPPVPKDPIGEGGIYLPPDTGNVDNRPEPVR